MSLANKLGGKACRHRWKTMAIPRSPDATGYRGKTAEDVERCAYCNVTRPLRTRGDNELPTWARWKGSK